MIYFSLQISVGLFAPNCTYNDICSHMDSYTFNGTTFREVAEKVKNVFGTDCTWTKTSSITLYCKSTECITYLNRWDNVADKCTLPNLIYGVQ